MAAGPPGPGPRPDDLAVYLLGGGGFLGVVALIAGGWAWYHRPSRYLSA